MKFFKNDLHNDIISVKLHYGVMMMNRDAFIKKADEKLKMIRIENDFTQDKMADALGISKKTLIQIEKGRASLGWSGAVTLCTVFRDSEVLAMAYGGQPLDIILLLAFNGYENSYEKTMGGKIWWKDIETNGSYKIQQNIISQHYRILDLKERRICSSFDYEYIKKRLYEIEQD